LDFFEASSNVEVSGSLVHLLVLDQRLDGAVAVMDYDAYCDVPTAASLKVVNHPRKWIPPNPNDLVDRYVKGESIPILAEHFEVSRGVIERFLDSQGVARRNRSEARRNDWARMSAVQRSNQVAAAHNAVRGMVRGSEDLRKKALAKERTGRMTPAERQLQLWLTDRGIATVPQQAIGPYNCDLGAFPVAVEVYGGQWHTSGRAAARSEKRFRYILDEGWSVEIVWVDGIYYPLTETAADDVAAFYKLCQRSPAQRGQYRVVRGTGQLFAAGRTDLDQLTLRPPAIGP
jgi:hypothetical protein